MKLAFSQIPEDLDVPAYMLETHSRLFVTMGLNETHFDRVAVHFVGALTHLNVNQALIDEAVAVIGPLRSVFEAGAREQAARVSEAPVSDKVESSDPFLGAVKAESNEKKCVY
jgi:hypothetical protein